MLSITQLLRFLALLMCMASVHATSTSLFTSMALERRSYNRNTNKPGKVLETQPFTSTSRQLDTADKLFEQHMKQAGSAPSGSVTHADHLRNAKQALIGKEPLEPQGATEYLQHYYAEKGHGMSRRPNKW